MDLKTVQSLIHICRKHHSACEGCAHPAFECEGSGCQSVDIPVRINSDCLHALRLFPEKPQDQAGIVASQVVECSAEGFFAHADIADIIIGSNKRSLYVPYLSQHARIHDVLQCADIRAVQIGKCLHQQYAVLICAADHLLRFLCRRSERLLAQDMLLRPECFDRPVMMELIGKRDINRLHLRVGEQFIIVTVRFGETKLFLIGLRLLQTSSCDRIQLTVFCLQHSRYGLTLCNSCSPQNCPFDLFHNYLL